FIFPLAHYLIIPAVLFMLTATLALTVMLPARSVVSWRTRILAAVACLVAVPKPFVLPSDYVVPDSPFKGRIAVTRTVTDTIDFVRSLGRTPPVHVLPFRDRIGELLGTGFNEVKVWQKGAQPLDAYIRDHKIDVIVSMEPGQESFLIDDPYWKVIQYDSD